ncbi:hypothetical protein GBAR_LOCUS1861, partial [Geodia barretti]
MISSGPVSDWVVPDSECAVLDSERVGPNSGWVAKCAVPDSDKVDPNSECIAPDSEWAAQIQQYSLTGTVPQYPVQLCRPPKRQTVQQPLASQSQKCGCPQGSKTHCPPLPSSLHTHHPLQPSSHAC